MRLVTLIAVCVMWASSGFAQDQTPPSASPPAPGTPADADRPVSWKRVVPNILGQMPPGWDMPQFVRDAGYRTELRRDDCGRFSVCVAYLAPAVIDKVRAAELTQTFPAGPYIGKSIRFSAWLRLQQASAGGYIHIRMRVDTNIAAPVRLIACSRPSTGLNGSAAKSLPT
jgi:hypothetical protein